jgi:hypothetical protein
MAETANGDSCGDFWILQLRYWVYVIRADYGR